jgi:hypothetical protein
MDICFATASEIEDCAKVVENEFVLADGQLAVFHNKVRCCTFDL